MHLFIQRLDKVITCLQISSQILRNEGYSSPTHTNITLYYKHPQPDSQLSQAQHCFFVNLLNQWDKENIKVIKTPTTVFPAAVWI